MLVVMVFAIVLLCIGFIVVYENEGQVVATVDLFAEELPPEQAVWFESNLAELRNAFRVVEENKKRAKNVVLFVALDSAESYYGDTRPIWESFPHLALLRPMMQEQHARASFNPTSMFCGIETHPHTIGFDSAVKPWEECVSTPNSTHHAASILQWAQTVGRRTGVVTNGEIVQPFPAALYAHAPNASWLHSAPDALLCPDVRSQLLHGETGRQMNVIAGTLNCPDEFCREAFGAEWVNNRLEDRSTYKLSKDMSDLINPNLRGVEYALGLYDQQSLAGPTAFYDLIVGALAVLESPEGFLLVAIADPNVPVSGSEFDSAMVEKLDTRSCVFSLLYSVGSFALACASLSTLNPSDRITVEKGALLISFGFVYFVALTEFLNKLLLRTTIGHSFVKRYRLRVSDVLDITNKLVSAVQAAFSCIAGLFVCRWSCPRNFLHASHFLSESYAWFAASYFFYDLWSMYKIYAAEAAIKIKAKLGLKSVAGDNNNVGATNGTANGDGVVAEKTLQALDDIPSVTQGTLSFVNPCKMGIPSFAKYLATHPLMVFHHLFIGSYGLVVISYLRGGLGDCVFSFMFMMELSTPFVSFRSILSVMGLKQSKLYVINGLVMLVSFFWCRIFLMPYVCYYYSQVINKPFIEAVWNLPWGCKASILALFLPQLYWFRLMVRGAMKVFFPPKNKRNATPAANSCANEVSTNGETMKSSQSKDSEIRSLM
uniref:alkaline phosphatase n=1 Tax=Anopheles culicifacies TaxID=139723 RepID=A0A182M8H0_9DIPT